MASLSSSPPQQVFINHWDGRNVQLDGFIKDLKDALKSNKINACSTKDKEKDKDSSQKVQVELKSRLEPKIALVIFSGKYTESTTCLRELAKINECVEKGKVVAIPIFFKLDASTVKDLRGQFGDTFRHLKASEEKITWKEALQSLSKTSRHKIEKKSPNPRPKSEIVNNIVEEVKVKMKEITLEESQKALKAENILKDCCNKRLCHTKSPNVSPLSDFFIKIAKGRMKKTAVKESRKANEKIPKDGYTQSLKICCVLLLLLILQQLAYMRAPLDDKRTEKLKEIESNLPKPKFPPPRMPLSYGIPIKFFLRNRKKKRSNIQVFINFRGDELRQNFISYLVDALQRSEINVFIDILEDRGKDIKHLFKRIEGSGIAIVVFSSRYTQSHWCLDELVKIKECAQQELLKVLPIYYKVPIGNVKRLKGEFGDHFRDQEYMYQSDEPMIKQWKEAIAFVSQKFALSFDERSNTVEAAFVRTVVEEVLRMLQDI